MRRFIRFFFLLASVGGPHGLSADDLAARVILVANSDDPDSLRIAQHYAEVRGVPPANLLALPMPRAETITWTEFVRTIWQPLQAELVRLGWIDAIAMNLTDAVGRTKAAASGHRISYLIVCRGVPLRITHDPALYAPVATLTNNPIFRTNAGAVDSELSLLANPNYPINAYATNPLHRNDRPNQFERDRVVKVSRLDAPSADDALALVDRAVAAERTGLLGRAYVDIGGNHPDGERWLEATAAQLRELAFDTDVDREPATIPLDARFDAPVLYFGWYAGTVNGPFTLPEFQFPTGAIALHIHSYSAQTLRSAEANWCGPLLARGVTATVGNVFEPYLQLTHRPDLLLRALARGETFGDAAYYAQPVLSWHTIAIGDPLYRPFTVTTPANGEAGAEAPARLAGYAVVRRMLELEAKRRTDAALELARKTQQERPSFAVGFALAERLRATGDAKGAADALGFVPLLGSYRSDEWALAARAARWLAEAGRAPAAVDVYRNLLRLRSMPAALKREWLPGAIEAAAQANDSRQADAWRRDLREIEEERLRARNNGSR